MCSMCTRCDIAQQWRGINTLWMYPTTGANFTTVISRERSQTWKVAYHMVSYIQNTKYANSYKVEEIKSKAAWGGGYGLRCGRERLQSSIRTVLQSWVYFLSSCGNGFMNILMAKLLKCTLFKKDFIYFKMCGCLSHAPSWEPGPQPKQVPWLGIKLATLWFAGWRSIRWATPATAKVCTFNMHGLLCVNYTLIKLVGEKYLWWI